MSAKRPQSPTSRLGAEWRRRIDRALEADEEVLWAGQPDPTMAMARPLPLIASLGVVVAVLFAGVTWLSWGDIRKGDAMAIALSGGLLLILLGLPLLSLWHRWRAGRTCYVLTSRRALIYLPTLFGKMRLTSYFPKQLAGAWFRPSRWFGSKAGDWIFRQVIHTLVRTTVEQYSPLPPKVEVFRGEKLFGFLMLRDALAIEALLRDVARTK